MRVRLISAAVALLIVVPVLVFAPDWGISLLLAILAGIGVYEMAGCVGIRGEWGLVIPSILLCFTGVFLNWIQFVPILCFSLSILYFVVYMVLRFDRLPTEKGLVFLAAAIYVTYGFFCVSQLIPTKYHRWLWAAAVIPLVADSFAYFAGRFFGKKKMCPSISPKKTVAGAIGGIVGTSLLGTLIYGIIWGWKEPFHLLIIFGAVAVLSLVSIFGDLFASAIKRRYNIKDYGKIMPGHGGVMDRVDSILPVAMIMYLLYQISFLTELF